MGLKVGWPRAAAALLAILVPATLAARQEFRLSRVDGDRMQSKLGQIVLFGLSAPRQQPRSTPLTEPEVNAYLRYHAVDQIPVGIVEPYISILGDGRLAARAVVDLDIVRKQKERGWLDPVGYLSGRLPVTARGVLHTRDGVGRIEIESATVSGVTVPKTVLQELVSHYSRTPENPQGVSLDAPFELPARIREIKVGKGQAVVVQ
jgi:hypothetical protein